MLDESVTPSILMNTQSVWNKMVHAPFKKVIKYDLICMAIGTLIGMGIGAYLVAGT